MPPKLTIIRKRTSYAVNNDIEKLQKEISETAAAVEKLKTELKQTKKSYQEEKNPKLKAGLKTKHEEGVKAYTGLTAKAKELDQKLYGLKKEYADLKAKEEEAALKAKKEAEAAAAAAAREGDIVIETDVVDENGNRVPLVLNYDDDYDKVVGDFVSLYGLGEEDYDDLLDQVYDVLSEDEHSDYDEYEYDDDDEEEEGNEYYGYDDDDDDQYIFEEEYFYEFNTDVKDPRTGEAVKLKIYNTDDFREKVREFKERYGVSDAKMLDELLLRIFSCFRFVEVSTFEIDGERNPLGVFSEDYEDILDEYAQENGLDDKTYNRLLDECDKALLFYDEVGRSFSDLMSNGIEINRGVEVKLGMEKTAKEMGDEMVAIVTEGRKVKGTNPKRFAELSEKLQNKKKVFDEKKAEYGMLCERLAKLYETRKDIERRFEDLKAKNKKYVPVF